MHAEHGERPAHAKSGRLMAVAILPMAVPYIATKLLCFVWARGPHSPGKSRVFLGAYLGRPEPRLWLEGLLPGGPFAGLPLIRVIHFKELAVIPPLEPLPPWSRVQHRTSLRKGVVEENCTPRLSPGNEVALGTG